MFHTECVGSLYQVSVFWSRATFHWLALVGVGGRTLVGGGVSSWTTLTLSVNPIILAEQ